MFKNWKFRLMCLQKISSGCDRDVYLHWKDSSRVVKVIGKEAYKKHANIIEWELWKAVEGSSYEKYFAKCYCISDDGKYLVQELVEKVGYSDRYGTWKESERERKRFKKKLPSFIADVHSGNFGMRGKDPVIFDYSRFEVMNPPKKKKRKKKK